MSELHLTASYSRLWGNKIILELKNKYPRATEIAKELLYITDANLCTYLITKDALYAKLRDFIKKVDKIDKFSTGKKMMSEYYSILLAGNDKYSDIRIRERLTRFKKETILKEQLNEGGECDATADHSPHYFPALPLEVDDGYGPQLCFQFTATQSAS